MMRLLYVITNSDIGGAQSHLLNLVEGFREEFEIDVAYGEPGPMLDNLSKIGIRTIRLPSLVRHISPLEDLRAIGELRCAIRSIAPDLVHAHSAKAGLISRIGCALEGTRVIFSAHGWGFSGGVKLGRRLAMWLTESLCIPLSDAVIVTCTHDLSLAESLLPLSRGKLRLIWNGIPEVPSRTSPPKRDRPTITMIARFCDQKDHLTLLQAFRPLRDRANLLLIGDGPDFVRCRTEAALEQLHEGVQFAGEQTDIEEILSRTDIMALSTHYEGLPISVLLGMRAGLPVVASRVGGLSDQIIHGVTGFLVPRKDPKALSDALQALVGSAELRHQQGQESRRRFEACFSHDQMISSTRDVYTDVLASRRRPAPPR